jgi:NTP pyrophosphatase (non-canonical NTP hydrolase)
MSELKLLSRDDDGEMVETNMLVGMVMEDGEPVLLDDTAELLSRIMLNGLDMTAALSFWVAKNKGWTADDVPAFVANVHAELSELWEAARKGQLQEPCDKDIGLTNLEEELADIIIRIGHYAGSNGIDIGRAVWEKTLFNMTRSFRHGNKKY